MGGGSLPIGSQLVGRYLPIALAPQGTSLGRLSWATPPLLFARTTLFLQPNCLFPVCLPYENIRSMKAVLSAPALPTRSALSLTQEARSKQWLVGSRTAERYVVCPVHDSVGTPVPLLPLRFTGAGCSSGRLDAMRAESSLRETIQVNLEVDQEATRRSCK